MARRFEGVASPGLPTLIRAPPRRGLHIGGAVGTHIKFGSWVGGDVRLVAHNGLNSRDIALCPKKECQIWGLVRSTKRVGRVSRLIKIQTQGLKLILNFCTRREQGPDSDAGRHASLTKKRARTGKTPKAAGYTGNRLVPSHVSRIFLAARRSSVPAESIEFWKRGLTPTHQKKPSAACAESHPRLLGVGLLVVHRRAEEIGLGQQEDRRCLPPVFSGSRLIIFFWAMLFRRGSGGNRRGQSGGCFLVRKNQNETDNSSTFRFAPWPQT